jgi:hypothetical protein
MEWRIMAVVELKCNQAIVLTLAAHLWGYKVLQPFHLRAMETASFNLGGLRLS